ncbi:hypothetical protein J2T38_000146 [Neisseria perflava]|uniref:nitroreductase family protein n=1 Tax=Neisseria perflava TaxID=33053 RepID=UPI0020A1B274|nr:nitroreductase family protein [Neisseria perflava]MCP1771354.1 hypothetical protein [Neisseria perflava]
MWRTTAICLCLSRDTARNAEIARMQGAEPVHQGSADRFLAGVYDATAACQNIVIAAESLGLGAVYLGSILNDVQKVMDLLGLPPLTFPVFALAVGYPDQTPQQKPRLSAQIVHMENRYVPVGERQDALAAYDKALADYYGQRASGSRAETFSHMAAAYTYTQQAKRTVLGKVIRKQGFFTELGDE